MKTLRKLFKKKILWLSALCLTGLATMFTAYAVDDIGVFELDGNAVNEAASGEDWDDIYTQHTGGAASLAGKILFIDSTEEGPGPDMSYLTRGTKDTHDLDTWVIDPGDVAGSKVEILDAFAALYNVAGHLITYMGFDREGNQGDANGSFWLLKQDTQMVPIPGTDQFTLDPPHAIGDILMATDYRQGGKQPVFIAFEWTATGLSQLGGVSPACDGSPHVEPYCAITNADNTVPSPWPYDGKNTTDEFGPRILLEGGVDLTDLLGDDLGCFSSFIAGTRVSHSPTAAVKDIALGEFDTCDISVLKVGDDFAKEGASPEDSAEYTITITNDGVLRMYKESIDDSLMGDLTDGTNSHIVSSDCGAFLDPTESCTIELDYPIPAGTSPGPLDNTVVVLYDQKSTLDGDERTADSMWTVEVFTPGISVTKVGDKVLAMAGDTVDYTVTILNTSSSNSPDLNPDTIMDTIVGDLRNAGVVSSSTCDVAGSGVALSPGDDCEINYSHVLAAAPDPLVNVASANYHPDGFTNDIIDDDDHSVTIFDPAYDLSKACPVVLDPDTGLPETWVAGETRAFEFTIVNNSDADSPPLILASITDALLGGDISGSLPAGADELSFGESHTFYINYTATDADAALGHVENSVSAVYQVTANGVTTNVADDDLLNNTVQCPVRPPAPARLILEKTLLGGNNLQFEYDVKNDAGEVIDSRSLTPLGSPDGFATLAPDFITLSTVFAASTTYTAEELLGAFLPGETEFVSLSCTENGNPIGTISGAVATLAADEDDVFVCHWINRVPGHIIIQKVTDPVGSGQLFDFTSDYGAGFQLADGGSNDSGPLNKGVYSVSETVPAGWELKSSSCDDGSAVGAIDLDHGETVTCTFYNEQDAHIIVVKQTDPDGSSQPFEFNPSYAANFFLTDGQQNNSAALDPGTYSVAETVPAGWENNSATCNDGSPINAIDLSAGETVTCTFLNRKIPLLTLVKEVDNQFSGSRIASEWTLFATGAGGFSGNSTAGPELVTAGVAYELSETQFEFYEVKTEWSCTGGVFNDPDGDPNAAPHPTIQLTYGDDVTCTIVNKDIPIEFCPEPGTTGKPLELIVEIQDNSAHSGLDVQPISHGDVFIDPLVLEHSLPALVDVYIIPLPGGDTLEYLDVTPGGMQDLMSALHHSGNGVSPRTQYEIYSAVDDSGSGGYEDGELIQRVGFHTSCSQILNIGHQYGLIKVTGGILFDGTVVNP